MIVVRARMGVGFYYNIFFLGYGRVLVATRVTDATRATIGAAAAAGVSPLTPSLTKNTQINTILK